MILASVTDLLEALRRYQVLTPDQLAELARRGPSAADPKGLAKELLQRGWLTAYQANLLLQGRGAELVLGSYLLQERLGEGGMGTVFKALHRTLGRQVAIKVIRKERLANPHAVKRFRREVRAAAQLAHPNIVLAFDADQAGTSHFLVMEYVPGTDLAQQVKRHGPLPIDRSCDYIRQAALGLQHAYEKGLIHRDIKPANLLVTAQGEVKLLDMGLARLAGDAEGTQASSTLTQEGIVMGTPDYLAPEQALGSHEVDIRADLYALGCTLYFLLTGRPPFVGGSMTEKLLRHQMTEPEPVERLRPDVPPAVAAVVRRLLAKRPQERYQTPAALAAALAQAARDGGLAASKEPELANICRSSHQVSSTPDSTSDMVARQSHSETEDAIQCRQRLRQLSVQKQRRRALWSSVAAAVVLSGLAVFVFIQLRPGRAAPGSETAPVAFRVAADRPWQDTGVDVQAGRPVTVRVFGVWQKLGHPACSAGGQEGLRRDRTVLPAVAHMALLGRIGEQGTPFAIGPESVPAEDSGRLWVRINDLDLKSNFGDLQLEIKGGARSGRTAVPEPTRVEQAEAAYGVLAAKFPAAAGSAAALREDVLAFRRQFADTPQSARAAAFLGLLPSPLDRLDPARIPADDRGVNSPPELVAVLGSPRWRHGTQVACVAWSPDGKWLASGGYDRRICLWHPATGRLHAALTGHAAAVRSLAFSPDGKRLASGGMDGAVWLWDVAAATGELAVKPGFSVNTLAFFPDGDKLVTGTWMEARPADPGEIKVWDLAARQQTATFAGHTASVHAVAVSADGKTLVSGGADWTVRLWDVATQKELAVLRGHGGSVYGVVISADSQTVASGGVDGLIKLWDVAGRKERATLKGHTAEIRSLSISPDGQRLASASADTTVRLWNLGDDQDQAILRGHQASVWAVMFAPDGKTLASGGADGAVRRWDSASGQALGPLAGHNAHARSVAFAPDGRLLSSIAHDSTVRLWDLTGAAPRERAVLTGHGGQGIVVAISPDGRLLASGGTDQAVRVWDLSAPEPREPTLLSALGGQVWTLAFSPDSQRLAVGISTDRPAVRVWDTATFRECSDQVFGRSVQFLAFRPFAPLLAVASTPGALYDLDGMQLQERPLPSDLGGLTKTAAFTADGRMLVAGHVDNTLRLWDLTGPTPVERATMTCALNQASAIAISADGTRLAAPDVVAGVRVWELPTGKLLHDWRLPNGGWSAALAPDGRHLATANGDGTLFIFRLAPAGPEAGQ